MAKKIPTARVKNGDVLAEPVVHGAGQVLLVKGTRLEKSHLDLLAKRGVIIVTVEEEGDEQDPDGAEQLRTLSEDEKKEIALGEVRWFGDARKDPLMGEVLRWVVQYRTQQAMRSEADA